MSGAAGAGAVVVAAGCIVVGVAGAGERTEAPHQGLAAAPVLERSWARSTATAEMPTAITSASRLARQRHEGYLTTAPPSQYGMKNAE